MIYRLSLLVGCERWHQQLALSLRRPAPPLFLRQRRMFDWCLRFLRNLCFCCRPALEESRPLWQHLFAVDYVCAKDVLCLLSALRKAASNLVVPF